MRSQKLSRHVTEVGVPKQASPDTHDGHHGIGRILHSHLNSNPESIGAVKRLGGSRIRWKYPDSAEILALIKISELLFDRVLRIPAVSSLSHYPDQLSSMAGYI